MPNGRAAATNLPRQPRARSAQTQAASGKRVCCSGECHHMCKYLSHTVYRLSALAHAVAACMNISWSKCKSDCLLSVGGYQGLPGRLKQVLPTRCCWAVCITQIRCSACSLLHNNIIFMQTNDIPCLRACFQAACIPFRKASIKS